MTTNPNDYCPDTDHCVACGRLLPEDPKPDTPAFEGYCDRRCQQGETGINGIPTLARVVGAAHETVESIARRLYKDTECGVSFALEGDGEGVVIASYVEGYDGELPAHHFLFPFHVDDWNAALEACDREADEIWLEIETYEAIQDDPPEEDYR